LERYTLESSTLGERALLLEAVTLLVKRQMETDEELSAQMARTAARVSALEKRATELVERLHHLDERLIRLVAQVEPDPGVPQRLAVLEAQLQLLSAAPSPA
jgi:transcriptional regulator